MSDLRVRLDELLPVKTAARELPAHLDRLARGEVEQLVITRRNEPRAVLISVERYEHLLRLASDEGRAMTCSNCGKERPQRDGRDDGWRRGMCRGCYAKAMGYPPSTEKVRRYRSDPAKRERDREASRRWKREHLGQPGLPRP